MLPSIWYVKYIIAKIPDGATVIQRNGADEIVTWETNEYGGALLATTLDPIVEHGVQQIRHLDNYVDNLVDWLCDVRPAGRVEIDWRIGLAA